MGHWLHMLEVPQSQDSFVNLLLLCTAWVPREFCLLPPAESTTTPCLKDRGSNKSLQALQHGI